LFILMPSKSDALFDKKIELIMEGIEPFFV
jgi:hypothetical protein